MHATSKAEDKELLSKLRKLISTNEKIKKAEAEFRLSCKEELAVLEEQNASSRRKLEEMAALDGRSPEGARRYLIGGQAPNGRAGECSISHFRKEELRKLRLDLARKQRLVRKRKRKLNEQKHKRKRETNTFYENTKLDTCE